MTGPSASFGTGRIQIDFTPAEGAVLRMLGLVERRGFAVCGMEMAQREGQGSLSLQVDARDPSRQLGTVAGQLRRLVEVRQVSVSPQPSGAPQ